MTVFSIDDFGAVPNVDVLQTEKIQAAIDRCYQAGGGEVRFPEGTWKSGGLLLRSGVTIHLMKGACLKGSSDPEDYAAFLEDKIAPLPAEMLTDKKWKRQINLREPDTWKNSDYDFLNCPGSRWNHGLIKAVCAANIGIIGEEGSMLDGSNCYDELGEEHYRGPHCVNLYYCENITVKGVTVKDGANWAYAIFNSSNIVFEHVTVLAGHDGVHATCCDNLKITNSEFYTGDDCVGGFANVNVLVRDCVMNSACSAFRFGATNALIENCRMFGPGRYPFRFSLTRKEMKEGVDASSTSHRHNMLGAFTYYAEDSTVITEQPGNIIVRGCRIENTDRFLHYDCREYWEHTRPLESITFEDITATDIAVPIVAHGDKDTPVTLTMKHIDLSLRDGCENVPVIQICNFERLQMEDFRLRGHCGGAFIKAWTDGEIVTKNIQCDLPREAWIQRTEEADEKFPFEPI